MEKQNMKKPMLKQPFMKMPKTILALKAMEPMDNQMDKLLKK